MTDVETQVDYLWNGGNVARYHTFHTLTRDNVGHHSYNVAVLLMVLRPDAPASLLRAALKHDVAEHVLGDMPAPTKRMLPDYSGGYPIGTFREVFGEYEVISAEGAGLNLEQPTDPEEVWILKLCDAMDGLRFCVQEMEMGNRHPKLKETAYNFKQYVTELLYGKERTHEILQFAETTEFAKPQDISIFFHLTGRLHNANR